MDFNAEESCRGNRIGAWLREKRRAKGYNQRELASALEELGVHVSGGGLSKWETGEHIPTPYQLQALRLLLQAEDPFGAPAEEELLSELNDAGRRKVLSYINDLKASGLYRRVKRISVRLYSMPASAGTGLTLEGEDYENLLLPENEVPDGCDFCIRVRGDSMLPRFRDGQLAFVHRCRSIREGEFGIFVLDGEAFIKQLHYEAATPSERENDGISTVTTLVSLNPAYPPRRVLPSQRLDLVGRVLNSDG